ncbi:Putative AC9 transposase [Linum perenne]
MAKDVLAVRVSTVASESAFSTGGRVLDAFRSSLTPKVVESLICTQNWVRSSTHPIDIDEKFEEIEELEKGIIYSIHVFVQLYILKLEFH